jgi:hypothetical protein
LFASTIASLPALSSLDSGIRAAIVVGAALTAASAPAFAETQVGGSREAVRIEAQNSSVEEILAALSRTFDMRYRSSTKLDKLRSGTYAGPLPQVLMRVLEGYNFFLKTDNGTIVATVVATANASDTVSAASASIPRSAEGVPAAQSPNAAADAKGPGDMSLPVIDEERPLIPAPALPASGIAPVPMPKLGQSEAPVPTPQVGPASMPAVEPGRVTSMPPLPPNVGLQASPSEPPRGP